MRVRCKKSLAKFSYNVLYLMSGDLIKRNVFAGTHVGLDLAGVISSYQRQAISGCLAWHTASSGLSFTEHKS